MRHVQLFTAGIFAISLGLSGWAADEPRVKSADDERPFVIFHGPQSSKSNVRMSSKTLLDPRATPEKLTADEVAILATAEAYGAAFSEADAKSAASQFTSDAEYVDVDGTTYRGRPAIEKLFTNYFTSNPRSKLEIQIDALRFVTPGVAIEDGMTTVTFPDESEPVTMGYTAVHVKESGKWMTASVREHPVTPMRHHRAQLQQLEWLVGDWIHEGDDSVVRFSCRPIDNGNFLLRSFAVHAAGKETMNGTQRIGWDARAGKFRAWVFDSDGGYAEGYWHRDGEKWVLKLVGVTADGQAASNTSIYSPVDARTMTFQSVDHEVAGFELPDSAPVTIVKQAPQPE